MVLRDKQCGDVPEGYVNPCPVCGAKEVRGECDCPPQNGRLLSRAKAHWPPTRQHSRSSLIINLHALAKKDLPILPCQGWSLIQNPEFNWLTVRLKQGTERLAKQWEQAFECLGQDSDVVVETYRFNVRLYRPVCTHRDKFSLQFHYLRQPPGSTYS